MEEIKAIATIAGQGGIAVVMLIVWYITSQRQTAVQAESFKKHHALEQTLIKLLQDEQEYKLELMGILNRLDIKLDTPMQCPFAATKKRGQDNEP